MVKAMSLYSTGKYHNVPEKKKEVGLRDHCVYVPGRFCAVTFFQDLIIIKLIFHTCPVFPGLYRNPVIRGVYSAYSNFKRSCKALSPLPQPTHKEM